MRNLLAGPAEQDRFVFIAEQDGRIIGAIIFSRLTYEQDERTVFILGPVAVIPDRQGKGVGQRPPPAPDEARGLVVRLCLHRDLPDVAMDAEEETATLALFAGPDAADGRPLVVVDPVDGRLNDIRGSPDFAVMGGLLRDGHFTAGLIHFPVAGSTFWAVCGAGSFADTPNGPRRLRVGGAEQRLY